MGQQWFAFIFFPLRPVHLVLCLQLHHLCGQVVPFYANFAWTIGMIFVDTWRLVVWTIGMLRRVFGGQMAPFCMDNRRDYCGQLAPFLADNWHDLCGQLATFEHPIPLELYTQIGKHLNRRGIDFAASKCRLIMLENAANVFIFKAAVSSNCKHCGYIWEECLESSSVMLRFDCFPSKATGRWSTRRISTPKARASLS